jgi:hypothetical protein
MKLITYGITLTSFLFTIFWPSTLQFSFFALSQLLLGQMYLLWSVAILPLVPPPPLRPSSPSSFCVGRGGGRQHTADGRPISRLVTLPLTGSSHSADHCRSHVRRAPPSRWVGRSSPA